jgi:hypothetical protein
MNESFLYCFRLKHHTSPRGEKCWRMLNGLTHPDVHSTRSAAQLAELRALPQ